MLSDETGSSKRISAFADSDERWMVAVRMVSEGVDVPRLSVGVYATSTSTPLFFAQAVGRFVRARTRGETASVFVPSVPLLLARRRDGARARPRAAPRGANRTRRPLLAAAERTETEEDRPEGGFAALASEADFDRVVFDGGEFGLTAQTGSAEEQDYLGLPGLLEPDQVKDLLRRHQADHASRAPRPEHAERGTHQVLRDLRGAQRAGGRLAPPHRQPARRDPRRPPHGLRRTADGRRLRRRPPAPDRRDPALGHHPQEGCLT